MWARARYAKRASRRSLPGAQAEAQEKTAAPAAAPSEGALTRVRLRYRARTSDSPPRLDRERDDPVHQHPC